MYATSDSSYSDMYSPQIEEYMPSPVVIKEFTPVTMVSVHNQPSLILFYAPWCHHCKVFMPIFKELADHLQQNKIILQYGQIDCAAHPGMNESFGLKGYPTLILFVKDTQLVYDGPRTVEQLTTWIKKNMA